MTNPNAATAAASAFMNRRESTGSLSSAAAAAAAALKALPASPTRVADVQTKRIIRRSASVSSHASSDGSRLLGLHHQPSLGSMTERTFRSRSPSPRRSDVSKSHSDAPPIPSIPTSLHSHNDASTHRKHGSLRCQVASERMAGKGRPSWFSPPTGDLSNVCVPDRSTMQPNSISGPDGRPGSRGSSVNFSYPSRAKPIPLSPDVSPRLPSSPERRGHHNSKQRSSSEPNVSETLVYDPNTRRMVPRVELLVIKQTRRDGPRKRTKSRRKSTRPKCGSHISRGSVPHFKDNDRAAASVSQSTDNSGQCKGVKMSPPTCEGQKLRPETARKLVPERIEKLTSNHIGLSHHLQALAKRPSTVKEEPELEEASERKDDHIAEPISQMETNSPDDNFDGMPIPCANASGKQQLEMPLQQVEKSIEPMPFINPGPQMLETQPHGRQVSRQESIKNGRVHSNSPVRAPRFAPTAESLTIRHSPPPRSVSPIKSALKHHTKNRDVSSSDTSESSAAVRLMRDNQPQCKVQVSPKKSVRVSFDDEGTKVIGQAALQLEDDQSAVSSSSKMGWFRHLGRNRKKELLPLDEDVMKPRPELPSFGSVRERKAREDDNKIEERPLVRPYDSVYSPLCSGTALPCSKSVGTSIKDADGLKVSNDHAIGAVILHGQASRRAADRLDCRDPLPPIVTSIDAYPSDIESSASTQSNSSNTSSSSQHQTELGSEPPAEAPSSTSPVAKREASDVPGLVLLNDKPCREIGVPEISIIQPSPKLPQPTANENTAPGSFAPPGRFPDDEPEEIEDFTPPSSPGSIEEPISSQSSRLVPSPSPKRDDSGSESSVSIYSDAFEDLSETELGFMSIDAVVESPAISPSVKPSSPQAREQITAGSNLSTPTKGPPPSVSTDTTVQASPPVTTIELSPLCVPAPAENAVFTWEHAKAYWRSLSMDKRRQLEREAMEEAGMDAVLDQEAQVAKIPTKKKSVGQRKRQSTRRGEINRNGKENKGPRIPQIQPGSKATHQSTESTPSRLTQPHHAISSVARESKIRKSPSANGAPVLQTNASMDEQTSQSRKPHPKASKQVANKKTSASHGRSMSYDTSMALTLVGNRMQPTLRRRGSSSSISSFKRNRHSTAWPHAFRQTMRSPSPQAAKGATRFSLRSLSPSGSLHRHKPRENSAIIAGSGYFEGTKSSGPPPDVYAPRKRRLHMPSFGRNPTESKNRRGFLGLSTGSTSGPFASSSDEDASMPKFRSRFADSSDEETAMPLRTTRKRVGMMARTIRANESKTVRNAPFSKGKEPATSPAPAGAVTVLPHAVQSGQIEAGSTSLPDSSDESMPATVRVLVSTPATPRTRSKGMGQTFRRSGSGREILHVAPTTASATTATSMSMSAIGTPSRAVPERSSRRRSSLMSVLKRKKLDDPATGGRIHRAEKNVDSWVRRDTRLERTRTQLETLRTRDDWPLGGAKEEEDGGSEIRGGGDSLWEEVGVAKTTTTATTTTTTTTTTTALQAEVEDKTLKGSHPSAPPQRRANSGSATASAPQAPAFIGPAPVASAGSFSEVRKRKFRVLRRMLRLDE